VVAMALCVPFHTEGLLSSWLMIMTSNVIYVVQSRQSHVRCFPDNVTVYKKIKNKSSDTGRLQY
jgi:hypothetical protein